MLTTLNQIDVLILCGGLGTRFRQVSDSIPKGLAPVGGKPLIELQIDALVANGARRIILCVGHLSDQIMTYFKDRQDVEIEFSEEKTPLGTGGALKNASRLIRTDLIVAMNGDSLCTVDYPSFVQQHREKKGYLSIVVSPSENTADYGTIELNTKNRILSFEEKTVKNTDQPAMVNAGVYLMEKTALSDMKGKYPISIERDFFPKIVKTKPCFAFPIPSMVQDIGTPERYRKINQLHTSSEDE